MPNRLTDSLSQFSSERPRKPNQIAGLLGASPLVVEVPNRNGYVFVRLRNNTSELIQAWNDQVSIAYDLPVLVEWNGHRYVVAGRDTERYAPAGYGWGSQSPYLPRHGSQHSFAPELGYGGDVTWVYSRQVMPFATTPSGTSGAPVVWIQPHVYRNPGDSSWEWIGDDVSPNLLTAKPTGTFGRMLLLVWDLSSDNPLVITGSYHPENVTGTEALLPYIPTVSTSQYVPLSAIRLVSGTTGIGWDNIYDMRQWAAMSTIGPTGATGPAGPQGPQGPAGPAGTFGVMGWDEGQPLGTGTVLNFVGAGVTTTLSGTVFNIDIPGGGGPGGGGGGGVVGQHLGGYIGTGTIIDVAGGLLISGSTLQLNATKSLDTRLASAVQNLPPADTILPNLGFVVTWSVNLIGTTQARLWATFGGVNPNPGTFIHAKYTLDNLVLNELSQNSDTEGRLTWISGAYVRTEWFMIDSLAANENCWIRLYTTGGNGTIDPTLGHVGIEFR